MTQNFNPKTAPGEILNSYKQLHNLRASDHETTIAMIVAHSILKSQGKMKQAEIFHRVMNLININSIMQRYEVHSVEQKLEILDTMSGGALVEDFCGRKNRLVSSIREQTRGS
jgi:hypothetical protein